MRSAARVVLALVAPLALAASCSVVNRPDEPVDPEGDCEDVCALANVVGASCEDGDCDYSSCVGGFLDCDGDRANGCEADTTSAETCGACDNSCSAGQTCEDGQCCSANAVDCNGVCVDTDNDAANCGQCGNACLTVPNATPTCNNGQCGVTCNMGWDDCNGGNDGCESDVSSDAANCGMCNNPCPVVGADTIECVNSQCVVTACPGGFDDCDLMADNGCEADLSSSMTCGDCNTSCMAGENCNAQLQCSGGVMAFGEFRPAMKCADFVTNGPSYQKYCFTLKNNVYCTGQHASGNAQCTDTPNGVKFVYDIGSTWPMRFTPNTQDCMNYNPAFIQNFALAIGYANYNVLQTQSGNSCTRTWLDANGNFQQAPGDASEAQIYDVEFF